MAASSMACQAAVPGLGNLSCTGSELQTLSSQATHMLRRSSIGLLHQTDQGTKKRRGSKALALMQADPSRSSEMQSPSFAAISLPFSKKVPSTATPEPETQTHVVQRGQVMSAIAQLYHTDLKTLHELNPGVALDYVRPKQIITVPKVKAAEAEGALIKRRPPKNRALESGFSERVARGLSERSSPPSKASEQSTQPASSAIAATGASTMTEQQPEVAVGELQYTVQPGDSLFTIAEKYGVSMTELVKLNKLHFKSTLRPRQVLKVPANSKPQAAVVASVCPAPPPTCPVPSRRPQPNWTVGLGLAILVAAAAVYGRDFIRGRNFLPGGESRTSPAIDPSSLQTAEALTELPVSRTGIEPVQAASPKVGGFTEQAPAPLPELRFSPPSFTSFFPTTDLSEAIAVTAPQTPFTPKKDASNTKSPPGVPSTITANGATVQLSEPPATGVSVTAIPARRVAFPTPKKATAEQWREGVSEVSPSVIVGEEQVHNGAALSMRLMDAANGGAVASLVDILPDGLVPLELPEVTSEQPQQVNSGSFGVGSSFYQGSTISRALQGAYRNASQSLGPKHQTLAFVALSSGRIGLASQDFTWGSTAEAMVALRSTLPSGCHLQGICTWGTSGEAEKEEKEWAAVLLFSAQGMVVSSGATVTTGSPRLAAEMAAEGLREKAVGKKLKAVIVVSSPQVHGTATDVIRDVIPGLPVYAISESKLPDSPGRAPACKKEWQVAPSGAASAVAPGISLVGVTTDADFGGAFFATVVGQWLYGPKCAIEALPPVAAKEMATSGR